MEITFLAASDRTRMAKRYALSAENGALSTTPYPLVRRFWSFTRNAADLGQLYALLVTHGEAGHCLLVSVRATPGLRLTVPGPEFSEAQA